MIEKLTVHDPRGYPPKVTGKRLAPRLEGLDNKIVYLVDCLFDNSAVFIEQLRCWLSERFASVDLLLIKPRESWVDDPDMRARIESDGDGAILGVGL